MQRSLLLCPVQLAACRQSEGRAAGLGALPVSAGSRRCTQTLALEAPITMLLPAADSGPAFTEAVCLILQEAVICVPMERRLPRIRVRSRQLHSLIGQRLVLQIDSWDRTSNYPNGHIVRVLGPCNDLKCAAESADGKAESPGSDLHLGSPPGALKHARLHSQLCSPLQRRFCLGCHECPSDILVGWRVSTPR